MGIHGFDAGPASALIHTRFGWIPRGDAADALEADGSRAPSGGGSSDGNAVRKDKLIWVAVAMLAVVLPAAGGYFYARWQTPAVPTVVPVAAAPTAASGVESAATAAMPSQGQGTQGAKSDLEPLTMRLAARLQRQADDGAGWVLLARAHNELKRPVQAAAAYAKAVTLVKNDPEIWAEYADVLVSGSGERWTDEARAALATALKLDPAHPKALWLAGAEAMARGDRAGALEKWERLATLVDADSDLGRQTANGLAQARQAAGDGLAVRKNANHPPADSARRR